LFPEPLAPLPYINDDFVTPLQDLTEAFDVVTATEVARALKSVNKNSAVGNDHINFTTLIYVNKAMPSLLPTLITALFRFGIHHKSWKEAICVVIPKQGKKSYTTPTSYRPISLLSCLGKVVEKIASKRISVAASRCGAISRSQFGNKENHSANDALFKTLAGICPSLLPPQFRNNKFISRPSLAAHDIFGAFNNTHPEALIRIMSLWKMPKYLVEWTHDFTNDRTLSFNFDNQAELPKPFKFSIPQGSPVSPILFSIMMCTITHPGNRAPPTHVVTYVDDMNESYADTNIGKVTPVLTEGLEYKMKRAEALGLSFAPDKSEVMHLSMATRRKTKFPEELIISSVDPPIIIPAKKQIKLLGVVVDETLSFIIHAQYAASRAMQALGGFLYLRKGLKGIPPITARHIALSSILPKLLWASPIWWTGSHSVLYPLQLAYHRIARWITGLPPSTRITKLLRCANLPPLDIWLDYLTTRYAISLIFSHPDHGVRPLPDLDPRRANRPGPQRILSFVSDYLSCNLEVRSAENPYEILTTRVHISKPTDDKGKQLETEKHSKWIDSLPKGTVLLYTDGSRSIIGDVGAGWVGFHKQDSGLLRIFEGYCYLGRSMEVYDAEIHAVKEALSTLRTISKLVPSQIYICIDNSAAISVLGDNPNRVQGATEACEVALALVNSGWAIQSVWAPSHIGIGGNEIADNLAKKGTYPNNNLCTASYTSKAWIERKAREIFLGRWRLNIGSENLSWKYPSEWEGWTYREARAYFRTYSGRTDIDPRHEHEATKCKCSTADLSSDHIIGYCPLFDQARSCIRGQDLTPPVFTKEMILDKNWGPGIRTFVKKTGLGFKSELRWPKQDLEYKSEAESDDEDEFEVGEFE
jgi:ribonuclease HI